MMHENTFANFMLRARALRAVAAMDDFLSNALARKLLFYTFR